MIPQEKKKPNSQKTRNACLHGMMTKLPMFDHFKRFILPLQECFFYPIRQQINIFPPAQTVGDEQGT